MERYQQERLIACEIAKRRRRRQTRREAATQEQVTRDFRDPQADFQLDKDTHVRCGCYEARLFQLANASHHRLLKMDVGTFMVQSGKLGA